MPANLLARASIVIDAPIQKVWNALVDPEAIRQYMFGTNVTSDWKEARSPGRASGRKAYEDKGVILRAAARARSVHALQPARGSPGQTGELPHRRDRALERRRDDDARRATQDNNPTEEARQHSERNWKGMMAGLKKHMES